MNGGKPVYVSSSITPLKGERLTGIRSKLQWADVDWKKVEEYANKLQTRITKAVKEQKRHLVKRLQRILINSFLKNPLRLIAHIFDFGYLFRVFTPLNSSFSRFSHFLPIATAILYGSLLFERT
jgi:hypothetical protein